MHPTLPNSDKTHFFQVVSLKKILAFGYELKNGEIKMKDLSQDSVDFMDRKFVFTSDVIDFLTEVFRACDFEASGKLSQREMELLFRPIGNYPEEFELSYDMSPVNNHTNSYGAYRYPSHYPTLKFWSRMTSVPVYDSYFRRSNKLYYIGIIYNAMAYIIGKKSRTLSRADFLIRLFSITGMNKSCQTFKIFQNLFICKYFK